MSESKSKPEVVAIYCPLWHSYDHMSAWKGEGWCEWELARAAKPRFPGHYQPLQPAWGYFDESDPAWSAREIDLAADHGIDVFLVDWYWFSGVKIMEEALERGLLKAPNRERIRFALMWANHNWENYFPPPYGQIWNSWLPIRHTLNDWNRVIDACIGQYFGLANYWNFEEGLFFSMFQPLQLVRDLGGAKSFRVILEKTNRRLDAAGLPPLHLNAMVNSAHDVDELRDAGYSSTTTYNIISSGIISPNLTERYEDLIGAHRAFWSQMSDTALPYHPIVTMGWDVTPRCEYSVPWPFPPSPLTGKHDYPYMSLTEGNTPERFRELCESSLRYCLEAPHHPQAVFINAWNEWTEGSYLLPEKRYGKAYLEAVREAFRA
jgi:hypothetical protein